MPTPVQAALRNLPTGSALLLGAAVAWFAAVPARLVAAVVALGGGLGPAPSLDLMDEAHQQGGCDSTALGLLGGSAVYTAADIAVSRRDGGDRERSSDRQQKAEKDRASPSRWARCWTAGRRRW